MAVIVESLEQANVAGPLHLALGMFDGVHLGHQAVIESAVHSAHRTGGVAGVLTFDPHPSTLFRPNDPTRLLQPRSVKEHLLRERGVALMIFQRFNTEFASVAAENFPAMLRQHLPSLRSLHIGENFRFGKGRIGDIRTLIQACQPLQIGVFSVERIKHNGEPISSTRIRQSLKDGGIDDVNELLGYTYFSLGEAIPGRQLGRSIGFPTLNLRWAPELKPKLGVYAVRVRRDDDADGGKWENAVANYGLRPTVENAAVEPLLEVHTLCDTELTTGDELIVEWEHFIRPEQKFDSLDALKTQIAKDKAEAVRYFS
ncbi:riboflavin biosynthesis protein RibF [Cerasicoccus frondis]|uniref:riboflavin biosynthesis protein RibF n=1 Tax=Cerasicoccus frondis TaxID=490090 RepID=UPI002852D123|nr:riboflavin biosynthesis protein RibF [Cerasicoccus frondis]